MPISMPIATLWYFGGTILVIRDGIVDAYVHVYVYVYVCVGGKAWKVRMG